jgi:hypothetical protein
MFKLGGDTIDAQGTGITSGLDVPRQGYADPNDKVIPLREQLSEIDVGVSPALKKRAFWSGIGEGFSTARTLGEALSGAVKGQEAILGPAEAKAGERKFKIETMGITGQFEADLQKALKTMDIESVELMNKLDNKTKKEVADLMSKSTKWHGQKAYFDQRLKDGTIDEAEYNRKMEIINTGFNLEKEGMKVIQAALASGQYYVDINNPAAVSEFVRGMKTMILALSEEMRKGQATGGRVGYQFGTGMQGVQSPQIGSNQPTQVGLNVDETIQTPTGTVQEDVSIRENIQPSVNMTYQEFRAKMPPQVDDEIVQLIYYNQDAFADFAQIKTQDEVYAFNNKWGVSLVLPFDTETT